MNMKEASSNEMYRSDKTSCTGSIDKLMRLIPRGDNRSKDPHLYTIYLMSPLKEYAQPELSTIIAKEDSMNYQEAVFIW